MRWDALYINANIATMDSSPNNLLGIFTDAALAICDDKISWIGSMADLPSNYKERVGSPDNIIDTHNQWITPGLIDCHTHLVYAGDRANEFSQRLHGATYEEIAKAGGGIQSTVAATRAATEQSLYQQSFPRALALAKEGVTTLEIKSGYGLNLESEMKMLRVAKQLGKDLGIRIQTSFLGAHCIPEEYKDKADDYINLICKTMLPQIAELNLADAVDGFCENIAFTPEQIEKVFVAANKLGLPVKLHAEQLSHQGGALLAAKYKALSAEHLEFASETSIRMMAQSGTVAVLLPGAYYFLRETRKPPIDLFRQHSVPMAIATDCNPGSSPCSSILLMLNMACTLFNMTPEEALLGITSHAAKALGLEKSTGSLTLNKQADFLIWNISNPEELCYRFGFNPLTRIVKKGKST
jgi:imidazolonepropionase